MRCTTWTMPTRRTVRPPRIGEMTCFIGGCELGLRWQSRSLKTTRTPATTSFREYAAQTGERVSTASFLFTEDSDTKAWKSHCVWTKGFQTLLPKTELVILRVPGQKVCEVTWERLIETAGDLVRRQDMYPERYRVSEFPSEEQLAAMGAKTVWESPSANLE